MKRFKSFVAERALYLNLADKPNGENLGLVDSGDQQLIHSIKSELNAKFINEQVRKLLSENNFPESMADSLIPVFKKYLPSDPENIRNFFNELFSKPFNAMKGGENSLENAAAYYSNKFSVDPKLVLTIAQMNAPSVGKGEFSLALFTNLKNATGAGDLELNGKEVEVKGIRARLRGAKASKKKASDAVAELTKIVKSSDLDKSVKDSIISGLKSKKSLSNTTLNILEPLIANADGKTLQQIASAFTYNKLSPSDLKTYGKIIHDTTVSGNTNGQRAVLLAIHLSCYRNDEGFPILLVFRGKQGSSKNNIQYVTFDTSKKSASHYYSMFAKYPLQVAGWADTPQEAAFGITITF